MSDDAESVTRTVAALGEHHGLLMCTGKKCSRAADFYAPTVMELDEADEEKWSRISPRALKEAGAVIVGGAGANEFNDKRWFYIGDPPEGLCYRRGMEELHDGVDIADTGLRGR